MTRERKRRQYAPTIHHGDCLEVVSEGERRARCGDLNAQILVPCGLLFGHEGPHLGVANYRAARCFAAWREDYGRPWRVGKVRERNFIEERGTEPGSPCRVVSMTTCICDTAQYAPAHTSPVYTPDGALAGYVCFHCESLWESE